MRKLKPHRGIEGLIPAIVTLLVFFFIMIVSGVQHAFDVLGGIFVFYSFAFSLWSFYKTNNYYYLISTFYMITCGFFLILLEFPDRAGNANPHYSNETKIAMLFFYFFAMWLAYVSYRKKLKYRGREILELAAWDVEEGSDTYTERPRPAGVVDYSKYDIIDFAHYLKRCLVCMPFREENRIILVPVKMGDEFEFLYKPEYNYLSKTWIAFDFDGKVSVHISRKDYLGYKEDLAFDQLCESLGQLFITFANFYMKGDKVRIIDRLNSVNIGLFS